MCEVHFASKSSASCVCACFFFFFVWNETFFALGFSASLLLISARLVTLSSGHLWASQWYGFLILSCAEQKHQPVATLSQQCELQMNVPARKRGVGC